MSTYIYSQTLITDQQVSVCPRCSTFVVKGEEGMHTRLHDEVDEALTLMRKMRR